METFKTRLIFLHSTMETFKMCSVLLLSVVEGI